MAWDAGELAAVHACAPLFSRHVILNPMAIDILEALPKVEGNPYLFPGKIKGNPINNPIKAFKRIIKRAGIESTFRLHDIRHTVASLIINNGAVCMMCRLHWHMLMPRCLSGMQI